MKSPNALSRYLSEIGKRGGNTTKKKGKEYYQAIGRAGALKRWGSIPNNNDTKQDVDSETSKDAPGDGRKGDA